MKKWGYLFLTSIFLLFLCACKLQNTSTYTDKSNYAIIYNDFLAGQINAIDKNDLPISIKNYLTDNAQDAFGQYAIYDMNKDATPELIIKTPWDFVIFTVIENNLTLWYENAPYCKPLNNGTILYERQGDAPKHTDYLFYVLDYSGNEVYKIDFSEYEATEYYGTAYPKKYFINNSEVNEKAYQLITSSITSISDDKINWKLLSKI